MPPRTRKQQRAARADLGRVRRGEPPRTFKGAGETTIKSFTGKVQPKKKKHRR